MGSRAPFLLYMGVLALLGCSAPRVTVVTSPEPSTLRVALGGVPGTLDPALQREPWERALASFYSEPLLQPTPDLTDVEPAAAASYQVSPDGLTYTFHLRPDGRFADGRPVTAASFVTAWRRIIDPRTASPHADLYASIVAGGAYAEALDPEDPAAPIDAAVAALGLRAPDPLTFQVTLAHPALWFKWVATVWAGAPQDNGPYHVASVADGAVTLVPNPHYRARPRIQKVVALEEGGADAVDAFRTGQVDLAPVSADQASRVAGDGRLAARAVRVAQLGTDWLTFNCYRPPFDRTSVRQAVAAAVDRAAYAAGPLQGLAAPATQLLPPGMPGRLPGPNGLQAFDPAGAKALLAGSGASLKGVHLLVESTRSGQALGDFVRTQLQANLGVTIAVDAVDAKTYAERIANRQFDVAGPGRWLADYPDPENILDQFTTGSGANAGRWQDQLFDLLVQLGDTSLDAGGRERAYAQAALEFDSQAPAALLDHPVAEVLVSKRLSELKFGPMDPLPVPGTLGLTRLAITS